MVPPSFFKLLLDASAPHLPLPPAFVSTHLATKIPKSPTIQSANGGYSWKLKIKQIGDDYCFVDGWINVVKDAQLGFGDFLVFQVVNQSTFKMSVYCPDGCEKILTQKSQDLVENGGDDEEKEDVDDYDYDEDEDENGDENDEDDNGDENDEDENGDENDEDDNGDEDDEDEDDDDDEVYGDDEEKSGDKNGVDPFFVSIMTRANKKILRLPESFRNSIGIRAEGTILLKNLEGKEWVMGIKLDKSFRQSERYLLSSGWCGFRRKNDLSEGDKCVFKFIRSEKKLLLAKVTKKIWPKENPPLSGVKTERGHEHGGDVDFDECETPCKRPRGRPPKQDPGFRLF